LAWVLSCIGSAFDNLKSASFCNEIFIKQDVGNLYLTVGDDFRYSGVKVVPPLLQPNMTFKPLFLLEDSLINDTDIPVSSNQPIVSMAAIQCNFN
jgi:hypothetical protein